MFPFEIIASVRAGPHRHHSWALCTEAPAAAPRYSRCLPRKIAGGLSHMPSPRPSSSLQLPAHPQRQPVPCGAAPAASGLDLPTCEMGVWAHPPRQAPKGLTVSTWLPTSAGGPVGSAPRAGLARSQRQGPSKGCERKHPRGARGEKRVHRSLAQPGVTDDGRCQVTPSA